MATVVFLIRKAGLILFAVIELVVVVLFSVLLSKTPANEWIVSAVLLHWAIIFVFWAIEIYSHIRRLKDAADLVYLVGDATLSVFSLIASIISTLCYSKGLRDSGLHHPATIMAAALSLSWIATVLAFQSFILQLAYRKRVAVTFEPIQAVIPVDLRQRPLPLTIVDVRKVVDPATFNRDDRSNARKAQPLQTYDTFLEV